MPVRTLILNISRLLVMLPLLALAAENDLDTDSLSLSEPATVAVAADDCEQLLSMHRRYRDADSQDKSALLVALENAILVLPGCAQVEVVLVRVEHLQGLNFFHPDSLAQLAPVQP